MPHTIALILAGGTGSRFGSTRPKQFTSVGGRTVLEHSIAAFEEVQAIDEIGIVAHPDHLDEVRSILQQHPHPKITHVVAGGKERQDSTINGMRAFLDATGRLKNSTPPDSAADCAQPPSDLSAAQREANDHGTTMAEKTPPFSAENGELFAKNPAHSAQNAEAVHVLIHDAVRPAVSTALIERVCAGLQSHAAVNVVLPVVDTLIEVDDNGHTLRLADRSQLRRVQTPQGFHAPVLLEAYRRALQDRQFRATDDCGVVLRYCPEIDIALVRGEERNLKLTYPEDLGLLAHYLTHSQP